jgi:tellurite resistance protein
MADATIDGEYDPEEDAVRKHAIHDVKSDSEE